MSRIRIIGIVMALAVMIAISGCSQQPTTTKKEAPKTKQPTSKPEPIEVPESTEEPEPIQVPEPIDVVVKLFWPMTF